MNWTKKLIRARNERKLTQAELGELAGLQGTRISKWERGDGIPSMLQIYAIARALGVTVEYLLNDELPIDPIPQAFSQNQNNGIHDNNNSTSIQIADIDPAVISLLKALGSREALRRLTFTSAVEVLPNPELQEVVSGQGAAPGPVRVNAPGMLEIGAFVVGKTTRVFYRTPEELRDFGEGLVSLAESLREQDRQDSPEGKVPNRVLTPKEIIESLRLDPKAQLNYRDLLLRMINLRKTMSEFVQGFSDISVDDLHQPTEDQALDDSTDGPKKRVS